MRVPKGGVAFFDSGIGGLTVLAACRAVLPESIFYYYGDNAHAPYGNLSTKKIRRLVLRAFRRLAKLRPKAVVLACNTVTALCVEELRRRYAFPVIGAEPAVFLAGKLGCKALILSTRATYESGRFQNLCERASSAFPTLTVQAHACDGLAGAIEEAIREEGEGGLSDVCLKNFLPSEKPDVVVLGCTHYVFIKESIARFYECEVVDGNEGIADRLHEILKEKEKNEGRLDHSQPQKRKKISKKEEKNERMFFLGGQKNQNRSIYERMFGLKVVVKGRRSQKN